MQYTIRKNISTDLEEAIPSILAERGVVDIDNFMNPTKEACELNPHDLSNINAGAQLLLTHCRAEHNIHFVADSDVDGLTSMSILQLYIKEFFPRAQLSLSYHDGKQHGLEDQMRYIETHEDIDLIVVPDAGSYDIKEHQFINDMGIDLLIIDHHEQMYDKNGEPLISTAPRTIIINNQLSSKYKNKTLCGAGLAYKFCEILDEQLNANFAASLIDLAALGEIADVMDRRDTETNQIIMQGLRSIQNYGLKQLLQAKEYALKDKAIPPYDGLTAIDVAFYIAPMLNAIIRVGSPMEKQSLYHCFIEPTAEVDSTKRSARPGTKELCIDQVIRAATNAQNRQNRTKASAMAQIDNYMIRNDLLHNNILVIEVSDDVLPQEMTGVTAMAVVSKYNKPTILGRINNKNDLQGSIRSKDTYIGLPDFKKFLEDSGEVNYVSGHPCAAGISIKASKIKYLLRYANEHLQSDDFIISHSADYKLDANGQQNQLFSLLAANEKFFGNHIDEPSVVITNINARHFFLMGENKDTIKFTQNDIDYIRFKDEKLAQMLQWENYKTITVYGRPNINIWKGQKSIQILIDDYELSYDDENKYAF